MPDTALGVTFNEEGLCPLCANFEKHTPKGEQALREEIESYVKATESNQYNCVVGVSGGRDSSYALYFAKEILGLKPIGVHNDTGFDTEVADKNITTISKKGFLKPLKLKKLDMEWIRKQIWDQLYLKKHWQPYSSNYKTVLMKEQN